MSNEGSDRTGDDDGEHGPEPGPRRALASGLDRLVHAFRARLADSLTMNCVRASSAKRPPKRTSSSKLPDSMMRPPSNTRMRVALRMVARRCAITNVVRPFITSTSAACTLAR